MVGILKHYLMQTNLFELFAVIGGRDAQALMPSLMPRNSPCTLGFRGGGDTEPNILLVLNADLGVNTIRGGEHSNTSLYLAHIHVSRVMGDTSTK